MTSRNGKMYETMMQRFAKRNAAIRLLKSKGWTVERLAKRFKVTNKRIYQILEAP